MNNTFVSSTNAQRALVELRDHEREARRLVGETSGDPLTRLAVAFDLRVRRLAHRVAARFQASGRAAPSTLR